ncbi:hypothetical protein D3C72_1580940 [compost metagenome]
MQIKIRIGRTQIVSHRTRHAHCHPLIAGEFLKIDGYRTVARSDNKLRHTHVRVTEQPQPQTGRCLGQPWRQVDFTRHQRPLQRRLIGEVTPGQVEAKRTAQPVHQLDIDPIELLQAPIKLGKRRLQHQTDAQAAMLLQPLLLLRLQEHSSRRACRRCRSNQGPAKTADKQQAAH